MKTEFFHHSSNLTPEGDLVNINGQWQLYSEVNKQEWNQRVIMALMDNPKSREVVLKMRASGITSPDEIVQQFRRCNWDALDNTPDIDEDFTLNFEYVPCKYKCRNQRCPFSMELDPKPFCIIKSKAMEPVKH